MSEVRRTPRGWLVPAVLTALATAVAPPAYAQDARVVVEIPQTLGRDVSNAVRDALRAIGPLGETARDVTREMTRDVTRQVGREIGPAVRDATRDIMREIGPLILEGLKGLEGLDGGWAFAQNRNYRAERVDRTSRTLALGTAGSLELRNITGNIAIAAGSGRDVVVEIVKTSRGRTDADAARGLEMVEVAVDHRNERALVETIYPRGNQPFHVETNYSITAPAGTRITARSISGNVTVLGIKADVSVETVSGNVTVTDAGRVSKARSVSGHVRVADVTSDGTLSAGTVSGNITLVRVRVSRLAVDVVSGDIRGEDVAADSAQMKSLSGSVEYVGRLRPNGRYELNSHSGSVRLITEGAVGFELQATSFSGTIRPEGLSLQSMSTSRGSLRGRVGDGSAVVVAGSFSGDVVVGRK